MRQHLYYSWKCILCAILPPYYCYLFADEGGQESEKGAEEGGDESDGLSEVFDIQKTDEDVGQSEERVEATPETSSQESKGAEDSDTNGESGLFLYYIVL